MYPKLNMNSRKGNGIVNFAYTIRQKIKLIRWINKWSTFFNYNKNNTQNLTNLEKNITKKTKCIDLLDKNSIKL